MSELEKNTLEAEIKASKKVSNIRKDIKGLTLVEVSELIEGVKEDFQIKEEALIQTTVAPTEEKKEEETGNVSVKWVEKKEEANLKEILEVIQKAVKELKGKEINRLEALKLTKEGDKIILESIAKDKAEDIKKQLEEKGAKVEIK